MKAYIILTACDDSQNIVLDVTEDEYKTLTKLAEVSSHWGGGCTPYMLIEDDADKHEYWSWTMVSYG